MNGCTVNIADFQALRAMNERRHSMPTSIDRSCRVIVLDPSVESDAHDAEMMQVQSASVHDIGEVRGDRGIHHRSFSAPSIVQRRARVLRFDVGESSNSGLSRGVKCWSCNADPTDCPPAA
jgi:hypothetical protein